MVSSYGDDMEPWPNRFVGILSWNLNEADTFFFDSEMAGYGKAGRK